MKPLTPAQWKKHPNYVPDGYYRDCYGKMCQYKGTILYDIQNTVFGGTLLALHNQAICAVFFGQDQNILKWELGDRFPGYQCKRASSAADIGRISEKLVTYIDQGKNFYAELDFLAGTPFQQEVWRELRKTYRGEQITYEELAKRIKHPTAIRAVGTAVGKNPIAVLIPCHRVVPKSGGMGRYHWGVRIKKALLEREAA